MGLLEKRLNPGRAIEGGLPLYSLQNKRAPRRRRKIRIPNSILVLLSILLGLGILIYLPPAIIRDTDPYHLSSIPLPADESALAAAMTYLRNLPDEDFDGDGLSNEKEINQGTSIYSIDSDGDGVTDYAELYITNTNPNIYDEAIVRHMRSLDAENDKQVNSPIKIHNVVLWPENYESRAKGGVVRTMEGYRFCKFTGWVQFPKGEYAYKIVNGVHIPLKINDNGYFYIDDQLTTVRVYDEPLEMAHKVSVFGQNILLEEGYLGSALTFLLPSRGVGLITCRRIAAVDAEGSNLPAPVSADIVVPDSFPLSDSRFGRNFNKLSDLAAIFDAINENQCAILSLYSPERGEAFVLAYAYNSVGNIFIADINTGEAIGAINYSERAGRFLDYTGEIQQYEWFLYDGCGFDSGKGDRLSIVGFADSAGIKEKEDAEETDNQLPSGKKEDPQTRRTEEPDSEGETDEDQKENPVQDSQESGDGEDSGAEEDQLLGDASTKSQNAGKDPQVVPSSLNFVQQADLSEFKYHPDIPLSEDLQVFTYARCQELELEYELVLAVIWRESRFNAGAVGINTNGTRDSGLMQINDINKGWLKERLGITNLMDPKENITAGTAILSEFMDRFKEERIALLAYGSGGAGAQRQLDRGITTNKQVEAALTQRDNYRTLLST